MSLKGEGGRGEGWTRESCVWFLLVVQHNVGHPDELRRDSDGRHIVEVGRTPPQLVIRPFLSMNTHFYVIVGHKTHLHYI